MKKMVSLPLAAAFALSGAVLVAPTASATAESDGKVCATPEGSIKVDNPPANSKELLVTAPDGFVITGYCVKAGSANQDLGPETRYVEDTSMVSIWHSSGKDISHYVLFLKPVAVTPPVDDTIITEQPPAPLAMNYCGTENDEIIMPETTLPITYVRDGNTVTIVSNDGKKFADGIVTKWDLSNQFPYVACPIFIVHRPEAPTVCKGAVDLPESTADVFYAIDSVNAYAVPQEGHWFVQDLLGDDGLDYLTYPIALMDEVCPTEEPGTEVPPVKEEPPVVAPPVTEVPPTVENPPAVVEVPPVVEITPVIETPMVPETQQVPIVPAGLDVVAEVENAEAADHTAGVITDAELANTGAWGIRESVIAAAVGLIAGITTLILVLRRRRMVTGG